MQFLQDYKNEFVELMQQAPLSDYEFIITAKRLGLDSEYMSFPDIEKLFKYGLSLSLIRDMYGRALSKIKQISESAVRFDFLLNKLEEKVKEENEKRFAR